MVAHLLKRHISSVDLAAKQPNEADTGNPEILVTPYMCTHGKTDNNKKLS